MTRWTMQDIKSKGLVSDASGRFKKIESIKQDISAVDHTGLIPKQAIFIPNNVPSSKNSRQLIGGDKPMNIESNLCRQYRKANNGIYFDKAKEFSRQAKTKQKPLNVYMFFIRTSKRRFDYHNACQLVFDLMTEYGWIDDDNADEVLLTPPVFGKGYSVNKNNGGVFIWI
jgi:hypothetical protein